jgi:hypothetical protein
MDTTEDAAACRVLATQERAGVAGRGT